MAVAARRLGREPEDCRLYYDGNGVNLADTLGSREVNDGDEMDLIEQQTGGKPVIYLYSPLDIDASVKLSLMAEWRFSAVYPAVPSKTIHGEQHIEWHVHTHEDGSLTEKNTGLDVSYLFWEAE
jgi:hypothetical protein